MPTKWCLMIYMAGDNNLDPAIGDDVKELELTGASADVDVLIQIDRREGATQRGRLGLGPGSRFSLEDISETNSGSAEALGAFIRWGLTNSAAEKNALIIWGHGSGWIPFGKAGGPGSLFRLKATEVGRWVGSDDGSKDALDMRELKRALEVGLYDRISLDLIAFDACLMAGVEVAFQIRNFADVMIASVTKEPAKGWPYAPILAALKARSGMPVEDFAKEIVESYVASYRNGGSQYPPETPVGCSAVRTRDMSLLAGLFDHLGLMLAQRLRGALADDYRGLARAAIEKTHRYRDIGYLDAGLFGRELSKRIKGSKKKVIVGDSELLQDCALLESALDPTSFLVHRANLPDPRAYPDPNSGLSVYVPLLPLGGIDPLRAAWRDIEWFTACRNFFNAVDLLHLGG